jgi:hypothetical protein
VIGGHSEKGVAASSCFQKANQSPLIFAPATICDYGNGRSAARGYYLRRIIGQD